MSPPRTHTPEMIMTEEDIEKRLHALSNHDWMDDMHKKFPGAVEALITGIQAHPRLLTALEKERDIRNGYAQHVEL